MNNRARHFVAVLLLLVPVAALASGVEVLVRSMFPSDRHTKLDFTQNTFRRVSLAKPADCASTPAKALQCQDIDVLNTLDGFNIQPRLSIPFSGPIDVSSVNSDSVFLISLGSTTSLFGGSFGDKVGINQVVWDVATNTLHVESDELLEQHTRYALVVTSRVRDAGGNPVGTRSRRHADDDDDDDKIGKSAQRHGVRIVGASVFTTQSTTSALEKIHARLNAARPAPASFMLGNGGSARTVYAVSSLLAIQFNRQTGTAAFTPSFLPLPALGVIPGTVGTVAFGSYLSPDYLVTPGEFFAPVATRSGVPAVQGMNTVYFTLFLPASPKPSGGWPVAIYGHGFTDSRHGSPFTVASSMAAAGIATIAINVVGHGGGALGTLNVLPAAGAPVVLPAGGRGIDQNGDGNIDSTEGSSAAAPRILVGSSDALRQTTVDLMQLVRTIQVGMDVDGDGAADLDPARIYYFGQSFGGIYGTIFLGIERDVRVGVPNVPGGAIIEIVRLSPVFRGLLIQAAAARGLINAPAPVFIDENFPLRDQPAVANGVAGAMALQNYVEQSEWASQVGNPVAYAPYIRKAPLSGNAAKSVIVQFARGDQTVPNPTSTALIRAGELADRATYFRNDIAYAASGNTLPKNPHTFLTGIAAGPLAAALALKAQGQIATFFASHGAMTIDPDDAQPAVPGFPPVFETPVVPPLPEGLNFIP
jgi:hypothetical protein